MASNSRRIPLDPRLHDAAKNGNLALLEELVPTPIQVEGQIAVPVAEEADEAPLQRLLGVTHGGNTALHIAACFGHDEVAIRICDKNCSLLMEDNDKSETPLHYAAKAGRSNIVTHFIQLANSEANNIDLGKMLTKRNRDGETALYQAVLYNHLAVVNSFLHADANPYVSQLVSIPNNENISPLYLAILRQIHDIVGSLIQSLRGRGDVSREAYSGPNGQTALHAAVLNSEGLSVVEEFLHAVEDQCVSQLVSIPNNKNISPLYLAIMNGQLDIVTALIRLLPENVSRGAYAGPDGQTALHAAALKTGDFVQKVLEWKLELAKSTDNSGSTPLHYAAASGNLEAVRTILQKNLTCAYMADSSGLYPIHLAVKMDFAEVVTELFDLCPDMAELLDKNGRNFVHLAVEKQREGIVRWICIKTELVEAMNGQDNNGDTAMHLAVKSKNINIFARLLGTKKAHLYVTNKDGLTPHDLAISERTVGFAHWQNANLMMILTLNLIRCCPGIKRRDHFVSEYPLQLYQKEEKIVENLESMAKNMAIGTVLIASAAFAAAFTVSEAYKADILAGHKSPGLSIAFKAFILMVVYAFVCSITATCLLIEAALTILDPIYREKYIMMSSALIKMATKGFVVSFAIGVYVVLTPVSKWLACLVCLTGAVVPVLLQPHLCPNFLVIRALIRYLGWRGFLYGCLNAFWGNILFGIFVLFVLIGTLVPSRGAFLEVSVLAYGTSIIVVSVSRFFPIGQRLVSSYRKGFKI